jgi:predicted AlkP superfamily pyrophosphatase or phosphodiesterase
VVGLTPDLLRHAPHLSALAAEGLTAPLEPVLPAVTCTAQSSMLTGLPPSGHGIVGNGWYFRDRAEVGFWKQSNHLVGGEKIWDALRAREPSATTAHLFWWYAMYGTYDIAVTPRPAYPADGRKVPDCWSHPAELRERLQSELGTFPLFFFWGPKADIRSTRWIAEAALRVLEWNRPTLSLVYLPHLDYALQKVGPDHASIPEEVRQVDAEAHRLIEAHRAQGYGVVVVSEYGITPVRDAVLPNRLLRDAGLQTFRVDAAGELLDHGASRAFAVPDHQLAHVYVRDPDDIAAAREALTGIDGIARVLVGDERAEIGLDHGRSGEIVLLSDHDRWFAHDWWRHPADAPDYQPTVDIHRKPGYDPRELFMDPTKPLVGPRTIAKVIARKLGFRNLLDFVPFDTSLVRGSHGLPPRREGEGPLVIADTPDHAPDGFTQTGVKDYLLRRIVG